MGAMTQEVDRGVFWHTVGKLWEVIEANKGDKLWSIPGKVGPWQYMRTGHRVVNVSRRSWSNKIPMAKHTA